MTFPWIYPVRAVQALFGVIVIGLTGYGLFILKNIRNIRNINTNKSPVVSTFYNEWSYSNTVNFLLFLGCWTTFVAVPYLVISPIWLPRLAHHHIIPAVEVITMIFWFAGFIAMGAMLPSPRWRYGSHGSAYSSLQAATIFGSFEWWEFMSFNFWFLIFGLRTELIVWPVWCIGCFLLSLAISVLSILCTVAVEKRNHIQMWISGSDVFLFMITDLKAVETIGLDICCCFGC